MKNIYLLFTYSDLGWVNERPHEAPERVVRERLTPKSDRVRICEAGKL